MQLQFDIQRSLNANPPTYPEGKGITFIKRKIVKLKDLRIYDNKGVSLQPRDRSIDEKQRSIEHSFKVNGVLYDKEVMFAELCDDGVLELISGFGRLRSLTKMGVDTYFLDIGKFESPYWKAVWKRRFNTSKDHIAKGVPSTEMTYVNGLVEIKNTKGFNFKNDDEVRIALFDMSDGQLDENQTGKLLKKFRRSNSYEEGVIALTQDEANATAVLLGLPASGYVKKLDAIGYVRYNGDINGKIVDFVNKFDEHGQKLSITGYIIYPVHDEIKKQREEWIKQFNAGLKWMKTHLAKKYHNILVFTGFLAQISTRDIAQHGRPKERGLVDVNGKIIRSK